MLEDQVTVLVRACVCAPGNPMREKWFWLGVKFFSLIINELQEMFSPPLDF